MGWASDGYAECFNQRRSEFAGLYARLDQACCLQKLSDDADDVIPGRETFWLLRGPIGPNFRGDRVRFDCVSCLMGSWPARLAAGIVCPGRLADVFNQNETFAVPASPPETRASLIVRLPNAADAAAWEEVVSVYGPLVYRLARRQGLQAADADDLVQEVLIAVSRSVGQWLDKPERGRFRAWLFRITRNTAINFLTRPKHRAQSGGGSDVANTMAEYTAKDDTSIEFDLEYRREVFRGASRQVRESVAEKTWQAFWQSTVEGRPIADVAEALGMAKGSVYVARGRVMLRLQVAVRELEEHEA